MNQSAGMIVYQEDSILSAATSWVTTMAQGEKPNDQPSDKPSGTPGDKPKSNKMLYGIIGGVVGVLLLCCVCGGGGGAGIYFFGNFGGPTGDLSQAKYDQLKIGFTPDEVDTHFAGKGLRTDTKGAIDFARRNSRNDLADKVPVTCETFLCFGNSSKMLLVGFNKTPKYGPLSTYQVYAEGKTVSRDSGGDPVIEREKMGKKK